MLCDLRQEKGRKPLSCINTHVHTLAHAVVFDLGLVTGAVHVTPGQKNTPAYPWPTSAASKMLLQSSLVENGQITNPAERLRLLNTEQGPSNLPGAITHTFTLVMDPDHVSKTPLCRGLWSRTVGTALQLCDRERAPAKGGQLHSPTSFKINQRALPIAAMGLAGPRSKAVLHMTTEGPDQRVPSRQRAREC